MFRAVKNLITSGSIRVTPTIQPAAITTALRRFSVASTVQFKQPEIKYSTSALPAEIPKNMTYIYDPKTGFYDWFELKATAPKKPNTPSQPKVDKAVAYDYTTPAGC